MDLSLIIMQLLSGIALGAVLVITALGLTIVFGMLGVVNFAHGALFMLGAFCAVTFRYLITLETITVDETQVTAWGTPLEIRTPLAQSWFGEWGAVLIDWSVPPAACMAASSEPTPE